MTTFTVLSSEDWVFPISGRRLSLIEDGAGNLRADEIPDAAQLADFYAHHFDRATYVRRGKAIQGLHRAWRLRRLLGRSAALRVLDFGFGNGQFLRGCRRLSREAELVGFEMSESQCRLLQEAVDAAAFAEWEELCRTYPDGFDLITAWHVLEHAPNPAEMLSQLYKTLRPGATCILAVPNRSSIGMEWQREHWTWCQPPFIHIWHFSSDGMLALVKRCLPDATVRMWTRDAWDCNLLVDTVLERSRLPLLLGNGKTKFRFESAMRLAAAALNELILNPVWFRYSAVGSELMVEIRKPADAFPDGKKRDGTAATDDPLKS